MKKSFLIAVALLFGMSATFTSCEDAEEIIGIVDEIFGEQVDPNNLYTEPYLGWGASKSTVNSAMSGYTLASDESTVLVYTSGKNVAPYYAYAFSDGGQLYASQVYVNSTNGEALTTFLNAKYTYKSADSESLYYLTKDGNTVVQVAKSPMSLEGDNSTYYLVTYYANTNGDLENPSTVLYDEPYFGWGASKSTVKSKMTVTGYTLANETETTLVYACDNEASPFYAYVFEDGQLFASQVYVDSKYADELETFLNNMYSYNNDDDDNLYFLTKNGRIVIQVTKSPTSVATGNCYVVTYVSYN